MPDLGYIGAHVQESCATWACRMVVERGSAEGGGGVNYNFPAYLKLRSLPSMAGSLQVLGIKL